MSSSLNLLCRSVACAAVTLAALPAMSTTVGFRVVAQSGVAAPGVAGGTFANVLPMVTTPGNVALLPAFLAPEASGQLGYWRLDRATGATSLLSLSIDGFPPAGGAYYSIQGTTLDQNGRVYLSARRRLPNSTSASAGLFTSQSGTTITPLILENAAVAGGFTGEVWTGAFDLTSVDASGRTLVGARSNIGQRLLAISNGGVPTTLLRAGQLFPGTSITVAGFGIVSNSNSGRFVFTSNGSNNITESVFWTGTSASDIVPVFLRGAPTPGIPSGTFFRPFNREITPNGTIAFSAEYVVGSSTTLGVWVRSPTGDVTLVARPGTPFVGAATGTLAGAGRVLGANDAGSVVFQGGDGARNWLCVSSPAGAVGIAASNTPAPGGGIFDGPAQGVAINGLGTIAFESLLLQSPLGDRAVFAYRPETGVSRVIGPGDVLTIAGGARTVASAAMLGVNDLGYESPGPRGGLYDNNELYVRVRFDDNSTAIIATFVPAPTAVLPAFGAVLIASRRRRW